MALINIPFFPQTVVRMQVLGAWRCCWLLSMEFYVNLA